MAVVEALALHAALPLVSRARHPPAPPTGWLSPVSDRPEWCLLLTLLWLVIAAMFAGYQLTMAANPFASAYAIIKALATTILAYWLVPYLSPLPASRLAGLLLFPFAACLLVP